jgi:hypothetical protein
MLCDFFAITACLHGDAMRDLPSKRMDGFSKSYREDIAVGNPAL